MNFYEILELIDKERIKISEKYVPVTMQDICLKTSDEEETHILFKAKLHMVCSRIKKRSKKIVRTIYRRLPQNTQIKLRGLVYKLRNK